MTDREHLSTLKAACNGPGIAEALGLRGRGRRFFCPVCQSDGAVHKTPDLAVMDRGFICHKCGEKGDLLKLVKLATGLTFPEAVAWLGNQTGIRPPDRHRGSWGKGKGLPARSGAALGRPEAVGAAQGGPGALSGGNNAPGAGEPPDPAVYAAFLAGCRSVEGRALDWLTKTKGVAPEVVNALGLRFCGREYPDVMAELKTRFGDAALLTAGLLKQSKTAARLVPTFWHYYAKKAGFLVIPYLQAGRPVYLKTRPPCGKPEAERLGLARFLNTAGTIPCLYNVDALAAQPDKVLVCEGESDTWTALSYGVAAVGSPGARHFKPAWVENFRPFQTGNRSRVYLVLDADKAGAEGSRIIADLFLKVGLPVPLRITLPAGKDLSEYIREMTV